MSSNKRKPIRPFKAGDWPRQPRQNASARILDGLNAMQAMDQIALREFDDIRLFGPKAFQSEQKACVCVWYLPNGYNAYQELTLFGLWAVTGDDEQTQIIIGTRKRPYTAPIYNAESFWTLIRSDYRTYFQDDHAPPFPADRLYDQPFDITRRIAMRQEIDRIIRQWMLSADL